MLKEAISYVYDKATELATAKGAKKLDWLSNPRKAVFELNGEVMERELAPALRNHTVDSVDDLVAAAAKWGAGGTIWLSAKSVVLIIDDADRRERVTLPLLETDTFAKARHLDQHSRVEQADLVRLLRREFRNAAEQVKTLAAVRKIKFKRNESGSSDIQHGNESMGRSVEAEVTGADTIPDRLTVPMNVYSNPGEKDNTVSVAFDLEIDVHQQKFVLKPMPDEIATVVAQSLESIRKAIVAGVAKDIPILYGCP